MIFRPRFDLRTTHKNESNQGVQNPQKDYIKNAPAKNATR